MPHFLLIYKPKSISPAPTVCRELERGLGLEDGDSKVQPPPCLEVSKSNHVLPAGGGEAPGGVDVTESPSTFLGVRDSLSETISSYFVKFILSSKAPHSPPSGLQAGQDLSESGPPTAQSSFWEGQVRAVTSQREQKEADRWEAD
jgi:hypothetical protein